MSAQSPSAIELEFTRRYDQEHARVCRQSRPRGLGRRLTEDAQPPQLPGKAEVEGEFRQAGLRLLSHQDFLPGCARMRVYVLRKTR
ncbi:hypothetical protein PS862_02931 [Pseudomonas fluorescens]|uniref:Uncharacterized protein n=1 Tax=Pseudomonas fluorescens TaxID=294 RepID=A0A5E7KLN1_PSEFL|nr:hypothetical protein [Pseudomonas fluorescens]VVP02690.1 hypothetical protein PS862_02931 [Pseudomonas fluorescens]